MGKSETSGAMLSKRMSSSSKKDQARTKESNENAIDHVFHAFDEHRNGRISRENIRSVAAEHGVDLSTAELNDMISFFDSSGTATLSRTDFTRLWQEASI